MSSSSRPFTLMGTQIQTPPRKKNSYRTKAYSSEVDETLFGTPTRYAQQVETRRLSSGKEWDPPWVTSPTRKGAPLLWTPFSYKDFQDGLSPTSSENLKQWSNPTTPLTSRPSSKYRLRSHTPSYVDETLFGHKLKQPSFKAPWNNMDDVTNTKPLLWSPQLMHDSPTSPRSDVSSNGRPGSRLGERNDPYIPPTPRDTPAASSVAMPVIKQRAGSGIKTRFGNPSPVDDKRMEKVKMKLEFADRNVTDKDELIERALRLARQAQEAAMKDGHSSSRRQAWNRPSSTPGSSPRNSARMNTVHMSDFLPADHIVSATGYRLPLSARGADTESRPNTERMKQHPTSRPLSAREANSRPLWKP